MFSFKQYDWRKYNIPLVCIVVILEICSAFFVKYAGIATENPAVGNSYFKRQIIWIFVSLIIMVGVSLVDYKRICDIAIVIYIVVALLALATQTPWGVRGGSGDSDAKRWLQFPGFTFQPSEVCKIGVILMLAVFFANAKEEMDSVKTFVLGGIIAMVPVVFILIQPDLSSSMVIVFIFVVMVFAAGISYKIFLPIVATVIPLVLGGIWLVQQPFIYNKLGSIKYQVNRIVAYRNPDMYKDSLNYQQTNSISSIASGGLVGKLAKGDIALRNYNRVDVCESDFIFSVMSEEVGFIGCALIIILLMLVVFMCVRTAKRCNDTKGYLIAIGISAMLMFQIFANIGVSTMILPNTGLPLPFLSRGITSAMCCAISVGVVLNIGMQSGTGDRSGIRFL